MVGWIDADLAFEGLLAAGPEFDRQAVIDATNQFTEYSAGGLVNPIDWTRQHNPPTEDDRGNGGDQECSAPRPRRRRRVRDRGAASDAVRVLAGGGPGVHRARADVVRLIPHEEGAEQAPRRGVRAAAGPG